MIRATLALRTAKPSYTQNIALIDVSAFKKQSFPQETTVFLERYFTYLVVGGMSLSVQAE